MSYRDMSKRLVSLELKIMSQPQGRLVILTVDAYATLEEVEQGLAEAHQAAGENGRVIHVQYVADQRPAWWGPEQEALLADGPSRPPYEIRVDDGRRQGYL